jgi:YkoY family integral membrane protein
MPFGIEPADLVTIGLLIVLEGLLSADNALVMAVMVLSLPKDQHQKALRYGLIGGFAFRILATMLAVYLIRIVIVKLLGGLYLLYLTYAHFAQSGGSEGRRNSTPAQPMMGLSAFWATVVRIELVNLAFSIDSILVAVAMSPKTWVVVSGGILGIVAMRLVVGQLLRVIQQYPALVDGAFIIIAWVGLKLVSDWLNAVGWISWHIPHTVEIGIVVTIFIGAYIYARWLGPKAPPAEPMDDLPIH